MNRIEFGYRAEPHATIRNRWLGIFHGQSFGVGVVKSEGGRVILFRSPAEAEAAAERAFFAALNGPKPARRKPKTLIVNKTGRFGQVFRSR
jgi:hypothetical protein